MSAEPAPPAPSDAELHRRLQRWVAASLISSDQARAIEELELRAAPGARARTPLLSEALIYMGGSLAVSAAVALLGPRWEELAVGARTAALAVGCAVTFLIGLLLRRSEDPAMVRVTSVAWAATTALSGWLAGQIAADLLDLHGRVPAVAFGLSASLVGAALYAVHPRALQQAALAIGLLSLAGSAAGAPAACWSRGASARLGRSLAGSASSDPRSLGSSGARSSRCRRRSSRSRPRACGSASGPRSPSRSPGSRRAGR